ncbi:MAG: histone deacetylase family protein [Candidatus Thorarchaeota archaeon]|nr:MAG: histone deacetylase family protein [Candidatus Thorarchaeota archaeon]
MPSRSIAFISHPEPGQHIQPFPRPHLESFENPLRAQMAELHLRNRGLLDEMSVFEAVEADSSDVLSVHSEYVLDTAMLMTDLGSGQLGEAAYASPELLRSALLSTGGAKLAANLVTEPDYIHSFSLMRPPGHHATSSASMGLCYFNNIAIAARSIQTEVGIKRISIVDIDDHFGNGTAEIFYSDPSVQYISIHEYDYESLGLGHYYEVGQGKAKGTNINIPLVEMSQDESYNSAFERVVLPAIKSFKPEVIGVSAGFDAHYSDPVGNMNIDSKTFWWIGREVNSLVQDLKLQGSFWVLEGGYNPFSLGPCIEASLRGLAGEETPELEDQCERVINQELIDANNEIIDAVLETVEVYW